MLDAVHLHLPVVGVDAVADGRALLQPVAVAAVLRLLVQEQIGGLAAKRRERPVGDQRIAQPPRRLQRRGRATSRARSRGTSATAR